MSAISELELCNSYQNETKSERASSHLLHLPLLLGDPLSGPTHDDLPLLSSPVLSLALFL